MKPSQRLDIEGEKYNRLVLMAIMLLGSFCIIMNQTLLTTAYPTIMKDMKTSLETVQWLTTSFLLVSGMVIPLSAYLMNRINSKILFIISLVFFLVGSLICYVASTFTVLLIGRLFQGVASGITLPLIQTCVLHMFRKSERGFAMGMVGLVVGLAPAIGPTLSGYIVVQYSWKWLFMLTVPFILFDLIAAIFYLKKVIPLKDTRLDYLSVIYSSVGFGTLLYGISDIGSKGGISSRALICLLIGVITLIAFTFRENSLSNPLLQLNILTNRVFSLAVLLSCLSYVALIGFESLLPEYIQLVRGETAFHSGLILLPGAIMMGMMNPITGKIFDRHGGNQLIPFGLFLLSIGTLPFVFLGTTTSVFYISLFYGIRLTGIAMVLMPITTTGMNALPNKYISNGTAINNTFRQLASSIGTAVLVCVLSFSTKNKGSHISSSQQINGYRMAFLIAFLFCLVAFSVSFILLKKLRRK